MKNIYLLVLFVVLLPAAILAQSTDAINYQAVVRDQSGQVMANKAVSLKISIILNDPSGIPVYSETHYAITNEFGLVNLEIGHGIADVGNFSKIDWSLNDYFLQVAIDINGGNDFTVFGTSRLLSVPYAFYAKKAGNSFSGDYNDLKNLPKNVSTFNNDAGYITLDDLQNFGSGNNDGMFLTGVPSQVWSLFGNRNSDPNKDKLGTTDSTDLVIVTNDLERIRVLADGDVIMQNSLNIGQDLNVDHNVYLNTLGGQTINSGPFTVANSSLTTLTGNLHLMGAGMFDSTLEVNGATTLNSSLDVFGPSTLHNSLHVTGATTLDSTLDVFGVGTFYSKLNVLGPTLFNDTLSVNGPGIFNSKLDVGGQGTFHSGITVEGPAVLQNTLETDGAATLNSTLHVGGATTLSSTLSVAGAATFNGPTTLNSSLAANGQVTIDASLSGGDGSYSAYPLRVQGSDQGIAIKVNGSRNAGKNFVTFWDANGRQGRIEGQTSSELHNSFSYIWYNTQSGLETAFQIAIVAADVFGVDDDDAAIVEGLQLVDILTNWGLVTGNLDANVGVSFSSGSGDYAEWLEKANQQESFSYGDIVGVSGGKISKSMDKPDMYLVVSLSPIVLGNMPPEGLENKYEKIAFLGQVPVKVRGTVSIGDYILASGMNDGFGTAVHPENITPDQFDRVVGVAWTASTANSAFSYINTAIGLNTNQFTGQIRKQKDEIASLKNNMNSIVSYLKAKDPSFDATLYQADQVTPAPAPAQKAEQNQELPSREQTIDHLIDYFQKNPAMLQQIMADARASLDKKGIDYNKFEQTRRLVTDESYFLDVLRSSIN